MKIILKFEVPELTTKQIVEVTQNFLAGNMNKSMQIQGNVIIFDLSNHQTQTATEVVRNMRLRMRGLLNLND